jgi:hypothetical protein
VLSTCGIRAQHEERKQKEVESEDDKKSSDIPFFSFPLLDDRDNHQMGSASSKPAPVSISEKTAASPTRREDSESVSALLSRLSLQPEPSAGITPDSISAWERSFQKDAQKKFAQTVLKYVSRSSSCPTELIHLSFQQARLVSCSRQQAGFYQR